MPSKKKSSKGAPTNPLKDPKLGIAVLIFVAAGCVWYFTSHANTVSQSDLLESVRYAEYRVQCSACGKFSNMPATDYVKTLGPKGAKCPACGAERAWRTGDAGGDPAEFKSETDAISGIGEIQNQINSTVAEIDQLMEQLDDPAVANDPAKSAELQKKLVRLRARRQAYVNRYEELTTH